MRLWTGTKDTATWNNFRVQKQQNDRLWAHAATKMRMQNTAEHN